MANYQYTLDLLTDVLFRAGEPTDAGSDYYDRALVYLNRAYHAVCQGGSELVPGMNEDWGWLTRYASGILEPRIETTIAATKGGTAVTFGAIPTDFTGAHISVAGWYLTSQQDIGGRYRIVSHTAGSTSATIDLAWIPATGIYQVRLEKLAYPLETDVLRLTSPVFIWYGQNRHAAQYLPFELLWSAVTGTMRRLSTPAAFSYFDQRTLIFDTAPTEPRRMDYEYIMLPPVLTNAPNEEPLVPLKNRRVIADAALFWVLLDKNDDRAAGVGQMVVNQMRGMASENRAALAAATRNYAKHLTDPRMTVRQKYRIY